MDFSAALLEIKAGKKVRREEWDKISYVVLRMGYPEGVPISKSTAADVGLPAGTLCFFTPYLISFNRGYFSPWTPDQNEVLANDWLLAD